MIFNALEFIRLNLKGYFLEEGIDPASDNEPIVLGNIASVEDPDFLHNNKILLSLVNVEEESTKRNGKHYVLDNDNVRYRNPSLNVNLYVLFTCNITDYGQGLQALSKVMTFFQMKNIFQFATSPVDLPRLEGADLTNLKLIVDLYTMTFEQLNHLWGALGGKQKPFAMYKIRLVEIQGDRLLEEAKPIEKVKKDLNYQNN